MNRISICHHARRQLSCAIRVPAVLPSQSTLVSRSSSLLARNRPSILPPTALCHLHSRAQRTFATMSPATGFYDFKPLDKRGQEVPLADYKGKVVLVVNTASKCGFTPQYAGLEALYKGIKEKHPEDFVVLGFPCNQFGAQEPGTDDEIQNFCQINYGVSFPIMQKIDVNGDAASPLYQWLKEEKPGLMGLKRIKWNFEKFLVGRDGKVKGRWASTTKPESLEKPILDELEKKE
ncbi:Glutathione peroxidase [Tolypocladium paradoxum]|uniref:Glutathione peroxidase n=1 Tax=Tolypocladium paradoxum TaxID=94208 RepID=A0A2S4L2X1_9HYPO|nr:Glutathione peroxidase [Tolypocladium paradoxum]